MKRSRLLIAGAAAALVVTTVVSGAVFVAYGPKAHAATSPYQLSVGALKNMHPRYEEMGPTGSKASQAHFRNSTCVQGLNTITNFCGSYSVPGLDSNGAPNSTWYYQMVGNAPSQVGPGTTDIRAPIIPVKIELLNADGSVAFTDDPMKDVKAVLNSPVFSSSKYTSGPKPTQFTDALARAEFYNQEKPNWHTILDPVVMPEDTLALPYGSYYFVPNSDGSCCLFLEADANVFSNLLAPVSVADNTSVLGRAELSGEITPRDLPTLLFDDTYLYVGDPNNCCIIGFHSLDFESGATPTANPNGFVFAYASWIQPGVFGGGFEDITALSHEMSETFNDPLVTATGMDITPWWSSGGNCQNDLETGDVVEGLANPTVEITTHGYTYHPQTEAMLQWFESGAAGTANGTPNAIDGAFSYPDETVLTSPNVSQNVDFSTGQPVCTGPLS